MKTAVAVATAAQLAEQFNSYQVINFLLIATVLVLLGMVWTAWSRQFSEPPRPRRRRTPSRN